MHLSINVLFLCNLTFTDIPLFDSFVQKRLAGNAFDKIVSGYQVIYGGQLDEDAVLSKCRNAITCVEKVDKEIGGDISSGIYYVLIFSLLLVIYKKLILIILYISSCQFYLEI